MNVTQRVPRTDRGGFPLVGVLGRFASLTLLFDAQHGQHEGGESRGRAGVVVSCAVVAQDLLSSNASDVTARVQMVQGADGAVALTLPGVLIDAVGTEGCSSADDVSDPGLVLRLSC